MGSEERIEVRAFTEKVSDSVIRYQLTVLKDSIVVWIEQVEENEGDGNSLARPKGSLGCMAASMPGISGYDGLPATSTLVGRQTDIVSERLAARLAKRCQIPVFASVNISDAEDVANHVVFSRVLRELEQVGVLKGE